MDGAGQGGSGKAGGGGVGVGEGWSLLAGQHPGPGPSSRIPSTSPHAFRTGEFQLEQRSWMNYHSSMLWLYYPTINVQLRRLIACKFPEL